MNSHAADYDAAQPQPDPRKPNNQTKGNMKTKTRNETAKQRLEYLHCGGGREVAKRLGYEQTAYTSTSALWGLFCLPENPEHSKGPHTGGCIIKTKQFGLMFVADLEDLHMDDLRERQVTA